MTESYCCWCIVGVCATVCADWIVQITIFNWWSGNVGMEGLYVQHDTEETTHKWIINFNQNKTNLRLNKQLETFITINSPKIMQHKCYASLG